MEYTVVFTKGYDDLIREVNQLISQGWKPQGGVAMDLGNFNFCQAMIR